MEIINAHIFDENGTNSIYSFDQCGAIGDMCLAFACVVRLGGPINCIPRNLDNCMR